VYKAVRASIGPRNEYRGEETFHLLFLQPLTKASIGPRNEYRGEVGETRSVVYTFDKLQLGPGMNTGESVTCRLLEGPDKELQLGPGMNTGESFLTRDR